MLGSGVSQAVMMLLLFRPMTNLGLSADSAWRVARVAPGVLLLMCALCTKLLVWDTPTSRRLRVSEAGDKGSSSMWGYVDVAKDIRVWVMVLQYGSCGGTVLSIFNTLAMHFRSYFQLKAADAATFVSVFGFMYLFSAALGGIASDMLYSRFGLRGRIWAEFLALSFTAVFLFGFGSVDNTQPWYIALLMVVCLSLSVQMADGTSYAFIPFVRPQHMALVTCIVGAGGSLSSALQGMCIYRPISDDLLPYKVHALYVAFCALLSVFYYWPEHGGMFAGPRREAKENGEDPQPRCATDVPREVGA
mmetsp:Transcript_109548/g.214715  ORF Transcript_109548/g.214715 Transcript_109548/m.214715 type:complete len:304 (+) Transcript_109548:1-912(+)